MGAKKKKGKKGDDKPKEEPINNNTRFCSS